MSAGDRAQSEVVGVALLIGVVVTAVGIVGVLVLSDSGANGTDDPLADLEIDATTTAINLTHAGGDAIPADDVRVVVRGEDRTQRLELDATNLTGSDWATGSSAPTASRDGRRRSWSFTPRRTRYSRSDGSICGPEGVSRHRRRSR